MDMFIMISLIVIAGLTAAMVIELIFKEGFVEVNTKRAIVYKNIWSTKPYALLKPGILIPGVHKKLREVTFENEPSDPPIIEVVAADGTKIKVDYVIYSQKVKDPVKAATEINYDKRVDSINTRISTYLQNVFADLNMEDLFYSDNGKKLNDDKLKEIERKVNASLAGKDMADPGKKPNEESVLEAWGIEVIIQIRNLILPEKLAEVAEEAATAVKEGQRIADKAKAAGVKPWMIALGDIIYDITRVKKEKTGKEKKSD